MLQEADHSITSMAMDGQGTGTSRPGDEQLLVVFYLETKEDAQQTLKEGRPIFKEIEYVRIKVPGSRDETCRPAREADIQRFPRHYQAFKARSDQPTVEGTLLSEWPGITRTMAEELKFFNVHTVEQLANMADTHMQNFKGVVAMKQKANAYLLDADANAAKQALAKAEEDNAELRKIVAEMGERLQALEGEEKPAPKRRGRPKGS